MPPSIQVTTAPPRPPTGTPLCRREPRAQRPVAGLRKDTQQVNPPQGEEQGWDGPGAPLRPAPLPGRRARPRPGPCSRPALCRHCASAGGAARRSLKAHARAAQNCGRLREWGRRSEVSGRGVAGRETGPATLGDSWLRSVASRTALPRTGAAGAPRGAHVVRPRRGSSPPPPREPGRSARWRRGVAYCACARLVSRRLPVARRGRLPPRDGCAGIFRGGGVACPMSGARVTGGSRICARSSRLQREEGASESPRGAGGIRRGLANGFCRVRCQLTEILKVQQSALVNSSNSALVLSETPSWSTGDRDAPAGLAEANSML
ncbi:dapper homolog 3-like [Pan paniscus]|uniref:dapper homolog 3-like n=1 Tax=Pan paniscus TaxID=9597 RepID=UPI0024371400|nr:dapper homolog 3-like [Pan paniscus]